MKLILDLEDCLHSNKSSPSSVSSFMQSKLRIASHFSDKDQILHQITQILSALFYFKKISDMLSSSLESDVFLEGRFIEASERLSVLMTEIE